MNCAVAVHIFLLAFCFCFFLLCFIVALIRANIFRSVFCRAVIRRADGRQQQQQQKTSVDYTLLIRFAASFTLGSDLFSCQMLCDKNIFFQFLHILQFSYVLFLVVAMFRSAVSHVVKMQTFPPYWCSSSLNRVLDNGELWGGASVPNDRTV